jgi:predicted small secreted protein
MRLPISIIALLALVTLAACHTVGGAGQDLQAAGSAITDEAQDTQSGM